MPNQSNLEKKILTTNSKLLQDGTNAFLHWNDDAVNDATKYPLGACLKTTVFQSAEQENNQNTDHPVTEIVNNRTQSEGSLLSDN